MAIVAMKRLFLVALKSDRDVLLNDLMKLSCVEISASEEGLGSEEMMQFLSRGEKPQFALENEVKQFANAIEALERYDRGKKPLFAQLRPVPAAEVEQKIDNARTVAEQVLGHVARLNELKSEENRLEAAIAALRPYEPVDVDLSLQGTAKTNIVIGTIPSVFSEQVIAETIDSAGVELILEIIGDDGENKYVFGLYPKDREEENWSVLKALNLQKAGFRDITGTAAENIQQMQQRLSEIARERTEYENALTAMAADLADLQTAYDGLSVELQKQQESEKMLCSAEAFFAECWVPAEKVEKLQKLLDKYDCSYEIRVPVEGENPPVLLQHSKLVEPFSVVTELYSLPAYGTFDPTPFVAVFFFILYGMMLGDAAYGAILSLACFLVAYKFKVGGMIRKLLLTLAYCGIATVIWGLLTGSIFGDVIQVVARDFFGRPIGDLALWFNPMNEPLMMLVICAVIGLIHIFVGMGISAYMLIKQGKIWSAVFDVGLWYCFIIGLLLLLLGAGPGKVVTIIGAAGLVLTQGRDKKNPVMKILSGIVKLYDISGYFSDVLSYSRIFALGLSTSVIASVFNTMGTMAGPSLIGVIAFIVIFVFGTVLNIALNVLGSFVHTSRLQYIEFFGKFFEAGGEPFQPLTKKTKYIQMIDEEAR